MRMSRLFFDVIPTVIVTAWLIGWAWPNVGAWVGGFKPAAAPMELVEAEQVNDTVVFSGTSARLWPQCRPLRIEWFLGQRLNANNPPVVVHWGKPIQRADGVFTFHGWIAEMDDVEAFKFNTFSNVLHRCRLFARFDEASGQWVGGWEIPFDIRTRFYR